MNRAFFSLYLVLVLALISLGWLTERIWRAYAPDDAVAEKQQLLHLLTAVVDKPSFADAQARVSEYAALLNLDLELYALDDFAGSSMTEAIRSGQLVSIHESPSTRQFYQRIRASNKVLSFTDTTKDKRRSFFYRFLIIGFYALIALVVYFWISPVNRDLKRLQKSTTEVGLDGREVEVKLGQHSVVKSLAKAFNAMAGRIRELLNAQKEMTHAISHELRTPLSRMKFALATFNPNQPDDTLEQIHADIGYMESMITEFLNYATFEARGDHLDFQEGELRPLVDTLVSRLGLQDRVSVMDSLDDAPVMCEWYLMEHCLFNLLQNAARYGHQCIRVSLALSENNRVSIAVEDDGEGILDEDKERIFHAFYRVSATANETAGFGLGLALVRRISQWHSGTVTVHSSELGGAKFMLTWPRIIKTPTGPSVVS